MQTRFTLRQLEYLIAVGRCGSITLAAEQLSVSPPSISNAIAQLETAFGLPLFVRKHTQGMTLTPSGRALMQQAVQVLESSRALSQLADRQKGTVQGELRVGCLLTFAQVVLPSLRKAYLQAHPGVEFRQIQTHQTGLIEALRDASIDVALTYDLAIPTDLDFVQLGTLPPVAVLPRDHPLAGRVSVSIEELAPLPMILLDLPLSSAYFLSLFERAAQKPRIAERVQDVAVLQSLVGNGFGYSILNLRPVFDRAPDGTELAFVPIRGTAKPMRMGLLCARGGATPLTVATFVDLCRSRLDKTALDRITRREAADPDTAAG